MRTLLVAGYWHPYNNAGTFRWLNFSRHIDFDVLTTKKPVQSSKDESIPIGGNNIFRLGTNIPAVVWGIVASMVVQFKKYDKYIITCPPESLLIGAYILQLRGKRVLVDMRDTMDRPHQPHKYLLPIYKWLYKKIRNVTVCWETIDVTKPCVYHGCEVMERDANAFDKPVYYKGRVNHGSYLKLLRMGAIPTFKGKVDGYYTSSAHPVIAMGYELDRDDMHEEIYRLNPISIEEASMQMKSIIDSI